MLVVILTSCSCSFSSSRLGDSPAEYCEKLGAGKCTTEKLDSSTTRWGYDKPLI